MNAQHTPGPWHRNIRAQGKYPTVFSGRNQHVAQALQQTDPAETEANIDLIAAAPELLAALRACEAFIAKHADMNDLHHPETNTQKALAAARAALNKAGGQS